LCWHRHPYDSAVIASVQSSGSDPHQQPFLIRRSGSSIYAPPITPSIAAAASTAAIYPSERAEFDGCGAG